MMSSKLTKIILTPDGSVQVNGTRVKIPNIVLQEEIGRGASGIVFLGRNPFLERKIATKLWLKMRSGDVRNKFTQGINEAKKAASLDGKHSLKVYDAGEAQTIFYMAMEYYPSNSLRSWLRKQQPSFYWRLMLALNILGGLHPLHQVGLLHGDLHTGNILIGEQHESLPPAVTRQEIGSTPIDFRFIDFGTSYFSGPAFSASRHWSVLQRTMDEVLFPLQMEILWGQQKPREATVKTLESWFSDYLNNISIMFFYTLENTSVIRGLKRSGDSLPILTREGHDFLVKLVSQGAFSAAELELLRRKGTPFNYHISAGHLELI